MENKEFKVGDKVYCLLRGQGEVTKVTTNPYPINVRFKKQVGLNFGSYTSDGKGMTSHVIPTLYHQKMNLTEYPKMMEVSHNKDTWFKRRVLAKIDTGYITAKNGIASWVYAREIQEKEVKELTLKEIAEKFECDVEDIRIKE